MYLYFYFFTPGRAWSAATTEGLLTYSLDVAMVFDPYDLAMDVTPESTKQVLDNREFAKALMLSFRLNEQDLILHVVESVPPQDSKYIDFLLRLCTLVFSTGIGHVSISALFYSAFDVYLDVYRPVFMSANYLLLIDIYVVSNTFQ